MFNSDNMLVQKCQQRITFLARQTNNMGGKQGIGINTLAARFRMRANEWVVDRRVLGNRRRQSLNTTRLSQAFSKAMAKIVYRCERR